MMSLVADEPRRPDDFERLRAAHERTLAVARQLGLNLHDAYDLATRAGCHLRIVNSDGHGSDMTADYDTSRINIETEGDIVISTSPD